MDSDTPRKPANSIRYAMGFAVHVFTACGAACALLALIAAVNGQSAVMFVWLGIALCIDAIDGTLARRLQVANLLPRWSGDVLDLVVDILNYVFVPAYALAASGLLPQSIAVALGVLIVVTGAIYFADRRMKTSDYYFRGFPALWNVAAFYFFILRPEPWAGAAAIIALAALTFVPFHFVHPVRIVHLRGITMVALAAWALLAIVAVADDLNASLGVTAALCALAIYFLAIGFFRREDP
jgi:phosphatidylcholine synthase